MTLGGTTKRVRFPDTSSGTLTNYINPVTIIGSIDDAKDSYCGQKLNNNGIFCRSLRDLISASLHGRKRNSLTDCCNRKNVLEECSVHVRDFGWRYLSPELFSLDHVCGETDVLRILALNNKSHESKMVLETVGVECILSQKKHRDSPKKSRTSWSTPLFIDRLKSEFQSPNFVPRVKAHRNWCPKFFSKYLHDNRHEHGEDPHKPLRKTLSRSFVPERPNVYSIGLRGRSLRSMDDNSGICNAIRNLKRCLNSVRRHDRMLFLGKTILRKELAYDWVGPPLSPSVPSIPVYYRQRRPCQRTEDMSSRQNGSRRKLDLSVRCSTLERSSEQSYHDYLSPQNLKTRKHHLRRCQRHQHNESRNRESLQESFEARNNNRVESTTKKSTAVQVSRRKRSKRSKRNKVMDAEADLRKKAGEFISKEIINGEIKAARSDIASRTGLTLIGTTRTIQDTFETKYSLNSPQLIMTAKCIRNGANVREKDSNFKTVKPTGSKYLTIAESVSYTKVLEAKATEIEILEDIKRRIDKDFEIYPLPGKPDIFKNFVVPSRHRSSVVKMQALRERNETEEKDHDLYSLNKDGEESEEFVSCRSSPYEIISATCSNIDNCKSLPIVSCTATHRGTTETEVRACFSTSTMIEPQNKFYDSKSFLLRRFCSLDSVPSEVNSVKNQGEDSAGELGLNGTESEMAVGIIQATSDEIESTPISKLQNIIDSTDSGVLTDCSPNELPGSESSVVRKVEVKRNDRDCSIYKREVDTLPLFDFNSDSCSDGSLERRVDKAVKTFTENLVLCERSAKTKLKMLRKRRRATLKVGGARHMSSSGIDPGLCHDFPRLCQGSSEDEKVPPFSTSSLSPFSDSEIENSPSTGQSRRAALGNESSRLR